MNWRYYWLWKDQIIGKAKLKSILFQLPKVIYLLNVYNTLRNEYQYGFVSVKHILKLNI